MKSSRVVVITGAHAVQGFCDSLVLKIREGITSYEDPGWYRHPDGTVAALASTEQLSRAGIDVERD